jgi:hypothetical protein
MILNGKAALSLTVAIDCSAALSKVQKSAITGRTFLIASSIASIRLEIALRWAGACQ